MEKRDIKKGATWIGILSIVLGLVFLALSIYVIIDFPFMIIVLAFLPIVLCAAGVISINRLGGYVIIDKEKQIISRRGRLFGFKYSVKFCDIENVVIVQNAKLREYIVIVDKAHINSTVARNGMIIAERKKSCIALENTEENMEFIRQICEGPILPPRKFGDDNAFH